MVLFLQYFLQTRNLSELDEARLRSCLDEIRNVIGDSITEASLADIILANDFDVAKSLNSALSNAADESKKPPFKIKKQGAPLLVSVLFLFARLE